MTEDNCKAKPRRWVMPVLLVSLAVNLLIAGLVAGSFLSPEGPSKRGNESQRAIRGVLGEPFFRALPKEERRIMATDIIRQRDKFREDRDVLRMRFDSFLTAIRAETFDRAEVERLMTEQREAARRRQDFGEALLLDRLETMTVSDRAAYADALEQGLKGLKRR